MIIQIFATIIIALVLLPLILNIIKDRASLLGNILWLLFWIAAIVAIWLPKNLFDEFGNLVGIGRGIDVVVYLSIILLFLLNLRNIQKINILEKDITKLTREIAKDNAKKS